MPYRKSFEPLRAKKSSSDKSEELLILKYNEIKL